MITERSDDDGREPDRARHGGRHGEVGLHPGHRHQLHRRLCQHRHGQLHGLLQGAHEGGEGGGGRGGDKEAILMREFCLINSLCFLPSKLMKLNYI